MYGTVPGEWKRWSAVLLKPDGLYATKPATGGNKAAKLKATRLRLGPDVVVGLEATRQTNGTGDADNEVRLRAAVRF